MSTKSPAVAVFGRTDMVVNEARHVDDEEIMTEGDVEMEQLSDASDASEEEMGDEDYETSRLRNIQENKLLLLDLGIVPLDPSASTSSLAPRTPPKRPVERQRKIRGPVYDRSGYIVSRPNPGETFRIACVEMPSDRKILRRITDGEYQDCMHWADGEERRWRFGDGDGVYRKGEDAVVGGVGPDFRWRSWLGTHRELKREMNQRGQMNELDMMGIEVAETQSGEVSAYSSLPGGSCHQCRRRSEKLKMKCRNVEKLCNAVFCETCCERYNDFEFDPDSRSFICPLCRNVCNCSNCLRKRGLAHLLEKSGLRKKSLRAKLREKGQEAGDVQAYVDREAMAIIQTPFDRVRIVAQDEDIISPELPPEPEPKMVVIRNPVYKKKKGNEIPMNGTNKGRGEKVKNGKTKKIISPASSNPALTTGLKIKFTIPRAPTIQPTITSRKKEVDSDGDTIHGDSSDDSEDETPMALGSRSRSRSQSRSRNSTTLSPPPYSHSPSLSPESPLVDSHTSFFPPAPMAYSLAQHNAGVFA